MKKRQAIKVLRHFEARRTSTGHRAIRRCSKLEGPIARVAVALRRYGKTGGFVLCGRTAHGTIRGRVPMSPERASHLRESFLRISPGEAWWVENRLPGRDRSWP